LKHSKDSWGATAKEQVSWSVQGKLLTEGIRGRRILSKARNKTLKVRNEGLDER
jgi:hypothetical protein